MQEKTILIIDDDMLNRTLIKISLRSEPYRILEASDAQEGIKLSREKTPDIILMDILLPDMDGWTASRVIKDIPELRDIPVIAVTGLSAEDCRDRAKAAGMDGIITKPFSTKTLPEVIKKYLAKC